MQRLSLAAARAPAPARPDRGLRLGIWEPIAGDDGALEFARTADTAGEWRYWADVDAHPAQDRAAAWCWSVNRSPAPICSTPR